MTWAEYDVASLLYDLCVKLGFCLPPEEQARLKADPPEDVDEFTDAVFRAEGMDARLAESGLYRQVREMIAEARSERS